ncbi:MAG: hypothetical protein ABIG84_01900 [archaeon]
MNDIAETAQIFLDQLRKNVFNVELLEKYDNNTKKKIINNAYFWEILRFLEIDEVEFKKRLNRLESTGFSTYLDILENKIKNKWIESVLPQPVSQINVISYHKAQFYYELLQDKENIEKLRSILKRSKSKKIEDMLKNTDKNLIFEFAFREEMLLGQEIGNVKSNQGVLSSEEFENLSEPGVINHQYYNNNIAHWRLENIEINNDKKNKKYVLGPLGILPLISSIEKIKLRNDVFFSEKLISTGLINKDNMKEILAELNDSNKLNFPKKDIIYYQEKFKKTDTIYKLNQYLLSVDDNILISCLNNSLKKKQITLRFEFYDINEKDRIIISNYGIVKTHTFLDLASNRPLIFSHDERSSFNTINNYHCFIKKQIPTKRLKESLEDEELYNIITKNPLFFYPKSISQYEFKKMLEILGFFNVEDVTEDDMLLLKSIYLAYFHFVPSVGSTKKSDLYRLNVLTNIAKDNEIYGQEIKSTIKDILDSFDKILKKLYFLFFDPLYQAISTQFDDSGDGTFGMVDICYESICDDWKLDYEIYRDSEINFLVAWQFEKLFRKHYVLKYNIEIKDIDDETLNFFKKHLKTKNNITKKLILEFYKNKIESIVLEKLKKDEDFSDLYFNSNVFLANPKIKNMQKKLLSLGDCSLCLSLLSKLLNKSKAFHIRFKDYFKRETIFNYDSEKVDLFKTIEDIVKYRNDFAHGRMENCNKTETKKLLENLSVFLQILMDNNNYPSILKIKEFVRNEYGIYHYTAYDVDNENKEYVIITTQNIESTHTYYIFYDKRSCKILYPTLIDTITIEANNA